MTQQEHLERAALRRRILGLNSQDKIRLDQLNQKAINSKLAERFDNASSCAIDNEALRKLEPVMEMGLKPVMGYGWDGSEYRQNSSERPSGGRLSVSGWSSNRRTTARQRNKERI